jgi:hypothetical protein
MSTALRRAIYSICTLLWLSGCAWLVMHFAVPTETDFGPAPNPWEPVILRIHGWSAVGGVFLLGWITAGHISDRWRRARNRVSGFSLAGFRTERSAPNRSRSSNDSRQVTCCAESRRKAAIL